MMNKQPATPIDPTKAPQEWNFELATEVEWPWMVCNGCARESKGKR